MPRIMTLTFAAFLGLTACGEAEWEEVPETAEIEPADAPGQLELDEETILGPDDIGEQIMATGWVVGIPLATGFFLRTEDDRVIFVETDQSVEPGQTVRVIGPLVAARATVFEGWETDAFETGFEAEWDVETITYIDATTVTALDATGADGDAGAEGMQGDRPQEGAGTGAEGDTTATDPGSKSN